MNFFSCTCGGRKKSRIRAGYRSHARATLQATQAGEGAMTPDEVLKIFEDAYVDDLVSPVDDATAGLAAWISQNHETLSVDDFALLTAVGAVLYSKGMDARLETPAWAKTAADTLVEAFRLKKK